MGIFCLGRSIAPFGQNTHRELQTLVVSNDMAGAVGAFEPFRRNEFCT
jgi:hypothetical protein